MADIKRSDVQFQYLFDLAKEVVRNVATKKSSNVSIVCKYEEGRRLLKCIVNDFDTDVNICDVEIYSESCLGYNSEFVITVWSKGDEVNVCCEPLQRDGKYIKHGGKITYIIDNCSSNLLPFCDSDVIYYTAIGELDEESVENLDDDGNSFVVTLETDIYDDLDTVSSFYKRLRELTKEEIFDMIKNF